MLYDSEQILLERATKGVYKKAILENFSIFTEKQGHKKQIKNLQGHLFWRTSSANGCFCTFNHKVNKSVAHLPADLLNVCSLHIAETISARICWLDCRKQQNVQNITLKQDLFVLILRLLEI